ncbi:tetratricopeptide repeat protein [Falsiroseomonas selenitidurans]|uniref:Tetratricopeptide repeat protein n=1 Tax=Falsiroseomonas selenitidurans TaxID=2716335 RepID=A0ABX1DXX0_9PROT|nr:tetratricopeptide repeat protein [Falsiroseomonas selenitidurans]NKC29721.1 tetratricopeptide repeat protein [Falsiroseomonas selenitidurans]
MRNQTRPALLGACAAAALAVMGAGGWLAIAPRAAQTAQAGVAAGAANRLAEGPEFERCVALLRQDPEAARAHATAWEAEGGGEGARHCHALALLAMGEPARAAQRLETLANRSEAASAARAAVYAQATQAWLMAGDANRAYGAATLALTLAPEDDELLVDRAVALGILGRYREAIQDLDRALGIEAGRAETLVFRAAAHRHLDQVEQAARDIDRALALDPLNAEALLERGILRQLRGDSTGAREDWERAIQLAPNSATADLAAQNLALNEAGPARR